MNRGAEVYPIKGRFRKFALKTAAAGVVTVELLASAPSIATTHLPRGVDTAPATAFVNGIFWTDADRGYANLGDRQRSVLKKTFPEIRPDVLNPQLNTGYATEQSSNSYIFYTRNAMRVDFGLAKSAKELDNTFRNIANTMQQDLSLGFTAAPRPEADTVVATVPSYFPLFDEAPGGNRAEAEIIAKKLEMGLRVGINLADYTSWDYRVDPETSEVTSVVRTLDVKWSENSQQINLINGVFNAASAAKVINIHGEGMTLDEVKKRYEVIGYMPLARWKDVSYDKFIEAMDRFYDWVPSRELYESVPDDCIPVFQPL